MELTDLAKRNFMTKIKPRKSLGPNFNPKDLVLNLKDLDSVEKVEDKVRNNIIRLAKKQEEVKKRILSKPNTPLF